MNAASHTMTCNIVVDLTKKDRFFMDMRVYEVEFRPFGAPAEGTPRSLVWRGLYLAVASHAAPPLGTSAR